MGIKYTTLQLINDLEKRLGGLSQASTLLGFGSSFIHLNKCSARISSKKINITWLTLALRLIFIHNLINTYINFN